MVSHSLKRLALFVLTAPTMMTTMVGEAWAEKPLPMTGKQHMAQSAAGENKRGVLAELGAYRFLPIPLTDPTGENRVIADSESSELDTRFRQDFIATAYSIKNYTACGVMTTPGIVAADPKVLPLGSIIRVLTGKYSGIYRVLDTGPGIRGKRLDIYVTCRREAINFGKQRVQIEVLRYGWGNREDTNWEE